MDTIHYAPIAVFVYNRLDHTRQTLDALLKNEEAKFSDLTIFSDGPKNDADASAVQTLRNYLKTLTGFKSVTLIEREKNHGLAESLIGGITQILAANETIIVLEDDLVSSPYFLKFMNDGLRTYSHNDQVGSILGYCLPLGKNLPETYFLKAADCWGWATWRRAWSCFERDGKTLLEKVEERNLEFEFDLRGSTFYTEMLKGQIDGRNNSWAIRWRASTFLNNLYSLYPGRSLIKNIGFDGSGTHCGELDVYKVDLSPTPIQINVIPVEENNKVRKKTIRFNNKLKITFLNRITLFTKKRLKLLFSIAPEP